MSGTYLVTGGTGLVGHHVARELVGRGCRPEQVLLYDASPKLDNVADLGDAVTLVRGSITDPYHLLATFRDHRPDHVIHLASASARGSWENLNQAIAVTCQGTNNVFEACRLLGARSCVYAVTSGVYGTADTYHWKPEPVIVDEDDPPATRSPYGATKYVTEVMAEAYRERYGLQAVGVRIGGVWGAGVGQREAPSDLAAFVTDVALGRPAHVPVFWTAFELLSVAYAKDVASQFVDLCELAEGPLPRRVYNQGTERPYTLDDLCDALRSVVPTADIRPAVGPRDAYVDAVIPPGLDCRRWYAELGFVERWPLEVGIRDFVDAVRAGRVPGAATPGTGR